MLLRLTVGLWILVGGAAQSTAWAQQQAEPQTPSRLVQLKVLEAGRERLLSGRVLLEAGDGGRVLEGRDGRIHRLPPQQIAGEQVTDEPFQPLDSAEFAQSLTAQLGSGFRCTTTEHYVICTDSSSTYARWLGKLFERLQSSFVNHWRQRDLKLHSPEIPLPVVLFANRQDFMRFARQDAGEGAIESLGYYSIETNQIVMFDLTRTQSGRPVRSEAELIRRLNANRSQVATVVHEATHQIAFNTGMNTRLADNPLWLTEGQAMYFESPDLQSRNGWRTIGRPNPFRMPVLKQRHARDLAAVELEPLVTSDRPFLTPTTIETSYAQAWALNYFLIKTHSEQYVEFLRRLQQRRLLIPLDPQQRLAEFIEVFGPLDEIQDELDRYWQRQLR